MSDASPPAPSGFGVRLPKPTIDLTRHLSHPPRRRLLALVALAAVALVVVLAVDSALLDIDEVTVAGSPHADADALLAGAGVERGDALITLDLGAVERRLEAMPWVDTASVERSLPGSLSISITERVPTAIVAAGDDAALVDGSGRVLSVGSTTSLTSEFAAYGPAGAAAVAVRVDTVDPLVAGSDLTGDLAAASSLATRLSADLPGSVTAVVVDDHHLSLELNNGAVVELGDAADLDAKIDTLGVVLSRVDLQCLATIDVRVPTRPVLTRDVACS